MSSFSSTYEKFKESESNFQYVDEKYVALRFDMVKSSKKLKNLKIMAGELAFYEAMMDAAKHLDATHKPVKSVFAFNDELNVVWEVKKEFCLQKVISKVASDITVYFNKSMSSVTERKGDAYIFDGRVVCGGNKKLMDDYLYTRQVLAHYAGMTRCIGIKKIPIELVNDVSRGWLEYTISGKYFHEYNAMSDYDKKGLLLDNER